MTHQLHQPLKTYPAGAQLRAGDICTDRKAGKAGLLPIDRRTWFRWVKAGRVPKGTRIGAKCTVWPIEIVLGLASSEGTGGVQ